MPTFTPISFTANTKIKSADVNGNFTQIQTILNAGILDANIASGAAILRNKMAAGTANAVVTNDGSGFLGAGIAPSTSGNVLTSNGTTWASSPASSAPITPVEAYNLGLSVSASVSALTIALKQADGSTDPGAGSAVVKVGMRSATATAGSVTERSVTSALSYTIPNKTPLSIPASTPSNVWVYLSDSDGAGTMALAVSSLLYGSDFVGSSVATNFTATITIATPGVVTANGHGLNNGDAIQFQTTGALPTGLSVGTTYYVISATANTFSLATTPIGSAIATSGTQSGTHSVHIAGVRLVSSSVITSKAFKLIGRIIVSLTTPGTWTAPSEVTALLRDNEYINCRLSTASGQSITSGTATQLTSLTAEFDSHSSFNNNAFIAPTGGRYHLSGTLAFGTIGAAGNAQFQLIYAINGGSWAPFATFDATGANIQTIGTYPTGSRVIKLNALDTLWVGVTQGSGHTGSLQADTNVNYLDIRRIGNY